MIECWKNVIPNIAFDKKNLLLGSSDAIFSSARSGKKKGSLRHPVSLCPRGCEGAEEIGNKKGEVYGKT
ncbi:MAG: hypothetical protein B1H40_01760 [Candidatus Latescibacteria bacterium 4484_181]|nr:MAG: hypothetical protein B1H40_01760 [Candidatus Latescibacteria bacterium 4484_181]RKY68588.1 MAG: hypothetical protein DRQ02_03950 [Candidatus Latescibacterota bacterium]RKY72900.1 MAG: hypothetical protein DRQ24_03980 [Candidatus Latescibacterota bacterium]